MTETEYLNFIRAEYYRLDEITGIDSSKIDIKISTGLNKKLGYFTVKKDGLFSKKLAIVISKNATKDYYLFIDVIRHEYAHALVYIRAPWEKHGHDKTWKDACKEVGCNPKSTIDYYSYVPMKELPYKYAVVCSNCSSQSNYKTNSQIVKIARGEIPGTIYCRKCNGTEFFVVDLNEEI